MSKITVQQAIAKLGELNRKKRQISFDLPTINGVVSVDGKDVKDTEQAREALDAFFNFLQLSEETTILKNAIAESNVDTSIDGVPIYKLLAKVKEMRNTIAILEGYFTETSTTSIVSGVGLVKKASYTKGYADEELLKLKEEAEKISSALDESNAKTFIEVDLTV